MIIKLVKPVPLRFKNPIINNVIARSKNTLIGISKENYNSNYNGISLPCNNMWSEYFKKNNFKYISKNRLLVYNKNDKYLFGFDFFQNIKSWSDHEINHLTEIFNDEIYKIHKIL
jgi:hypothetical protein